MDPMSMRQHSREIILEKFFLLLAVQEGHACAFGGALRPERRVNNSWLDKKPGSFSMPDAEYSFPVTESSAPQSSVLPFASKPNTMGALKRARCSRRRDNAFRAECPARRASKA